MNPSLPPIFFYAIGTLLSVFGVARALTLGRRHADRELTDDTPERRKRAGVTWSGESCGR